MAERYLTMGVAGLTLLGIMGEAPKLSASESLAFVKEVLARVASRAVWSRSGSPRPASAAIGDLANAVMDLGASGVMIAPPSSCEVQAAMIRSSAISPMPRDTIGTEILFVLQ